LNPADFEKNSSVSLGYFTLFCDLLGALSHSLRGPLSVISNDLNYLSRLSGPEEYSRSLDCCRNISDILREACSFGKHPLVFERSGLPFLFSTACRKNGFEILPAEPSGGWEIAADCERFILTAEYLLKVFRQLEEASESRLVFSRKIRLEHEQGRIHVLVEFHLDSALLVQPAPDSCLSLSRFASHALDFDSYLPALADLGLFAHGATLKVQIAPPSRISIFLPEYQK